MMKKTRMILRVVKHRERRRKRRIRIKSRRPKVHKVILPKRWFSHT